LGRILPAGAGKTGFTLSTAKRFNSKAFQQQRVSTATRFNSNAFQQQRVSTATRFNSKAFQPLKQMPKFLD